VTDSTSRLLANTRRRLFVVTLGLVALLVVGIGAASAFVALRALDSDVDRALIATVDRAALALGEALPPADAGPVATAVASAAPDGGSDDGDGDAGGSAGGDGEDEGGEATELAASDTFLLVLDTGGMVLANPSGVSLPGVPDATAVAAATASGADIRTVDAGGTPVRLRTVAVTTGGEEPAASGAIIGYVQGGFVLTLHDAQSRSIILAVVLVGLIGLVGAAFVTLIVTGRALVPIRRSFDAQRRFVADASHELRTPAALIRANADVVEREGLVTADGEPLVADIITEADRLGRLVGDLLQLATAEASGITVEPEIVDLAEVVDGTVRQAEALATERGVRLDLRPAPGEQLFVLADRDRLVQMLLILLDNAFDHSPADGTVTIDARRVGSSVQVTVADEGPGVPPSERERVFEPFTRLPGVRRDRSGGTGLGLAIARRIATAHHGTIHVADAPSGGAAFVLTLPVHA
jgi:signal transduction histidine kinase